jgi:hypothetical protein
MYYQSADFIGKVNHIKQPNSFCWQYFFKFWLGGGGCCRLATQPLPLLWVSACHTLLLFCGAFCHLNSHMSHYCHHLKYKENQMGTNMGRFRFFYSNSILQCYQHNSVNKSNLYQFFLLSAIRNSVMYTASCAVTPYCLVGATQHSEATWYMHLQPCRKGTCNSLNVGTHLSGYTISQPKRLH